MLSRGLLDVLRLSETTVIWRLFSLSVIKKKLFFPYFILKSINSSRQNSPENCQRMSRMHFPVSRYSANLRKVLGVWGGGRTKGEPSRSIQTWFFSKLRSKIRLNMCIVNTISALLPVLISKCLIIGLSLTSFF